MVWEHRSALPITVGFVKQPCHRCCDVQERLAQFMGTQESIIYSYDLATIPSVLPAFANTKDLIVCDEVLAWSQTPSLVFG